jgi:hypothetical protein
MRPPTTHDLCLNVDLSLNPHLADPTTTVTTPTTTTATPSTTPASTPFLRALTTTLDAYPLAQDINNREQGTLRTPLITLLRGLAWGQHSEAAARQLLSLMLARGADPRLADAEGDTALHWAARLGLAGAAVLFVRWADERGDGGRGGGGLLLRGVVNARGQTARDVGVEAMGVAALLPGVPPPTGVEGPERTVRVGVGAGAGAELGVVRHAEVVLFLETGVVPE